MTIRRNKTISCPSIPRVKTYEAGMKTKKKINNSYPSPFFPKNTSLYDFSDGEEEEETKKINRHHLNLSERILHYFMNVLQRASSATQKYFHRLIIRALPKWFKEDCPELMDESLPPQSVQPSRPPPHAVFHSEVSFPLKNGSLSAPSLNGSLRHAETSQQPSRSHIRPKVFSYAQESARQLEGEKYKLLLQQYTRESIKELVTCRKVYKDAQVQARPEIPAPLKRPLLPLNSIDYRIRTLHKVSAPSFNYGYSAENSRRFKSTPITSNSSSVHQMMGRQLNDDFVKDLWASLEASKAERSKKIETCENLVREYQKKREAKHAELEKRLKESLNRKRTGTEEEDEEEEPYFRELSPEMEAQIEEALRSKPDQVLAEGFRLSISRKDMETLIGLSWLNDEIINFYMNLLMERSKSEGYPTVYAFNTFFYTKLISGGHGPLRRWTRKVDIFSYDLLLIPVHMESHWCLAVIDFRSEQLKYYDSLGGKNMECLASLAKYLQDERLDKKKEEYDMSSWTYQFVKDVPLQMNGSDCGMFTLKYSEYITRDAKINFTQAHMPYFRRRMMYEILTKTLL